MDDLTGLLRNCSLMTCIDDLDVWMSLQEYCAFVHWGLVLMTCIDDLDVGMTLQEYCAMVHTGLCSYCICYDGLSVTEIGPLLRGVFSLECMEKWIIFFLRCTDVLWYFLWRFESVVLLCVGLYGNSLREAIFDTQILWWTILFWADSLVISPKCSDVIMLLLHMYSCVYFFIILLYLCMRGWCHFGLYWFSFVLLPCLYDFQVEK